MKYFYYAIILILLGLIWSIIEAQVYFIKEIRFKSKKIKRNFKIVFISDIHYGDYYLFSRLKRIIKTINDLKPDLIIIGGDYVKNTKKSKYNQLILDELFSELSFLRAKKGIITVLGNHDYYFRNHIDSFNRKIKDSKMILLKNNTYELVSYNDKILIHGVDDLEQGKININNLQINNEYLNILISHNPDFFEEYEIAYDIGLSGHTHGGQITVFGLYAPITESRYGQKYAKTINKKGDSIIVTSKGLGVGLLPIRFFAPPQIIEITIEASN